MGTRVYEFRQGRPHFEAMIFACATGLAILLAAGATLRTSDAAVPAGRPEPTTHASAAPTPTVRRPSADEIDSAWVSQSSAPTISVGGDATLTLRFRNTGTVAWIRGAVSEVSLAYVGDDRRFDPRMSVDWPLPGRPATQSENAVAPGEVATFTFKVRGTAAGTYRIDLRPTMGNVGWLRAEGVYVDITVR
jgi:hypothetical protein